MPTLAELIRSKYPGKYDDIGDDELEEQTLARYPQYKDLVPEKPSIWQKATEPLTDAPTRFAEMYLNISTLRGALKDLEELVLLISKD